MGAVEEFEAAEFDERDVAAGQFDLKRAAVMGGAEQDGLLLQRRAALAVLQNSFDDVARLVGLVADADEAGAIGRLTLGPEVLGEAFRGKIDDAIGGGEDRLGRAIIAIERDDLGRRAERGRENRECCARSAARKE